MDFYLLVITATTYSSAVCQFIVSPYFISPLSACFLSHFFCFLPLTRGMKTQDRGYCITRPCLRGDE